MLQPRRRVRLAARLTVLQAALAACSPAVAESLAQLELEDTPVGYRWHGKRNGEDVVYEVVARNEQFETFRSQAGCEWSHLFGDRYSPNLTWKACGGPDGRQTVTRTGDPYPLGLGSRWQYHVDGSDEAGNRWSGVRECRIDTTREVELGGRRREAYEVRCIDPWRLREWVVVPGDNVSVSSVSRSRDGESVTRHVYVRHTVRSE